MLHVISLCFGLHFAPSNCLPLCAESHVSSDGQSSCFCKLCGRAGETSLGEPIWCRGCPVDVRYETSAACGLLAHVEIQARHLPKMYRRTPFCATWNRYSARRCKSDIGARGRASLIAPCSGVLGGDPSDEPSGNERSEAASLEFAATCGSISSSGGSSQGLVSPGSEPPASQLEATQLARAPAC